ncbi:MAG: hypothetical protein KF905_05935 [Flavobacteriales bacterium]|nr:hypothetical protein [Flavobacteriales bacterium]
MRFLPALYALLLAAALMFSDLITVVRVDACPDENIPALIGLPLPYRTSIPWVNSMSGVLYMKGLLIDLAFWSLVAITIRWSLLRAARNHPRTDRFIRTALAIVAGISAAFMLLFLGAIEWHLEWSPDLPFQCPEWSLKCLVGP